MTDVRGFLAALVSKRDRINAAIGGLRILLEEDEPPAAAEVRALPAPKGRRAKGRRKVTARAKPAKRATATKPARPSAGMRKARISDETIAKIQQLDGQGKPRGEIAKICGVSAPTVAKYADMPPVKTNGTRPEPAAAPAARVDPKTGRPWV